MLNKLCEGKVKYIDMAWNVMVDYNGVRIKQIIALAPQWLNRLYMESRKEPKIIHYAGPQKPWLFPEMDFGAEYWEVAKKTMFYEILLYRMTYNVSTTQAKKLLRPRHKTPLGLAKGFCRCLSENGLAYTIRHIPKRIFRKGA